MRKCEKKQRAFVKKNMERRTSNLRRLFSDLVTKPSLRQIAKKQDVMLKEKGRGDIQKIHSKSGSFSNNSDAEEEASLFHVWIRIREGKTFKFDLKNCVDDLWNK